MVEDKVFFPEVFADFFVVFLMQKLIKKITEVSLVLRCKINGVDIGNRWICEMSKKLIFLHKIGYFFGYFLGEFLG